MSILQDEIREALMSPIRAELRAVTQPLMKKIVDLEKRMESRGTVDVSPGMITVSAAARALDVCEETIRRQVREGKMPYQRIGHRIYVDIPKKTD